MHKSHNRVYNDSLWTEIETIQWVLAQILMLMQQSYIHEELTVFFGHNYHVNFVSYLLNATIRYFLTVTIQLMNKNNM